jgi:flagella basal body P-ring formation protein FlgA
VPVTVAVYKDVIVITKPLPRGTILEQENMRVMKYDMSQLPAGYVEDQQDAVGMELTRRLASDTPLTTNLIRKPKIIKRGQQVSIIARSGGMEVRMMGKALEHGAVGERIRVQNLRSKKKVEGTVTPSGDVRVDI